MDSYPPSAASKNRSWLFGSAFFSVLVAMHAAQRLLGFENEAVAEAYGWGDDERAGKLTEDEILARLFALNQQRAGK